LLRDPILAVRIAAARGLSSLPPDRIDAATRPAFDAALAEYIAAQSVSLDMPGAQLNLAVVYQNTARIDLAERHYPNALRIDPDFTPARANLAGTPVWQDGFAGAPEIRLRKVEIAIRKDGLGTNVLQRRLDSIAGVDGCTDEDASAALAMRCAAAGSSGWSIIIDLFPLAASVPLANTACPAPPAGAVPRTA